MICSKCGTNNIEGQTFCGSCGSSLANTASAYAGSQDYFQQPATPPGGPSNGGIIKPKSYLTESIIVTAISFLCCSSIISLILGIIAIVKANNVDSDFNSGNISSAIKNSESAKKLTIWAAIVAVIWIIVFVILYVAFIGALLTSSGGLDSILK